MCLCCSTVYVIHTLSYKFAFFEVRYTKTSQLLVWEIYYLTSPYFPNMYIYCELRLTFTLHTYKPGVLHGPGK